MVECAVMVIIAYLIGSINFSIIFSKKMAGFDGKREAEMPEQPICLGQLARRRLR